MDFSQPARVNGQHWAAIQQHAARVSAQLPGDHSGTIGACKDLVECVAKVVLEEATLPAVSDFSKVVKKASGALAGASAPSTVGASDASMIARGLGLAIAAHETTAQGLGDLRNSHGAGHGRPMLPVIADEDVQLVMAYTEAWVRWALVRLERLVTNSVSTLIGELTSSVFRSGMLSRRFRDVGLDSLDEAEQERLGFAVAERGARRGTNVIAWDGVTPLQHDADWPLAYQRGVALGLLLSAEGRIAPLFPTTLVAIVPRLDRDSQERLLDQLDSSMIERSLARDGTRLMEVWNALRPLDAEVDANLASRWSDFANRFYVMPP